MLRKKNGDHLQPLKISKTEASYQSLLLEMMSKLVAQQRQSNRLLKKLTGQPQNQHSSVTIRSPKKPHLQSLQKSFPAVMTSFHREQQEDASRYIDNLSEISPNTYDSIQTKERVHEKQKTHIDAQKMINGIENLGDILKRIQTSLAANLSIQKQKNQSENQGDRPRKEKLRTKQFHQITNQKINDAKEASNLKENKDLRETKEPKEHKQHKQHQTPKKTLHNQNLQDSNFLQSGFNCINIKQNKQQNLKKGKAKNYQKKGNRLSAFDIFRIEDLLESKISQIKPSLLLNKESQDKNNYSILTQILPFSDKREIKIKVPLEEIMNYYQIKKINNELQASTLTKHWLGNVYRATSSICWNLLSDHQLSLDQAKILFTENIIYNLIQFMKTIRVFENNGNKINRCKVVEEINSTSVNILEFLCSQYPQTKVQDPNIALRNQIPSIDNKGQAQYDLISKISQSKEVIFRRKENGDYTQQIMKTINYMIERSNQQFDRFKDFFSNIFGQIFLPIQKRKSSMKQQENHDDQIYYEKVKSYTKYIIGQKINKNTPKYTEQQIQNGIFFVKSPSILRVITKWVEQLDQIIRNPQHLIKNTQNQFKDHHGISMYLYAQIKNGLFKQIRECQQYFESKVKHIKQECYHMQVLLALQMFTNDQSQKFISRQQTSVGKYCYYLKSAISSYICSELNQAIHFLLTIPSKVNETKIGIVDHFYQQECKKDLLNVNLINFKIFDLLRCKCISKQSQIVYLIRRLNQKSNDPSDPFKIIRIKDRLDNGTRDILINAQLGKGLVCEIQLAVISNIDKKQQLLDQFNHFLYQLKRAKLGPISQNAAIWSTLEQRATYFESLIQRQQKQTKYGQTPHTCINVQNSQNSLVKKFIRPIICVSCNKFYQMPRTCLLNVSCDKCKRTYCGQCHFVHMSSSQRKQYLFEKHFRPFFPYLTEYQSFEKPIPKFGFLVKKIQLKKQVYFFRTLTKNTDEMNQKGKIEIEIIISMIQNGKIRNEVINQSPIQVQLKNGGLYIKQKRYKEKLSSYIIYSIDTSKQLQIKSQKFSQIFELFQKDKLKYINLLKQPAYVQQLKMIKRSKQMRKQSKQLRNILPPETCLTYLKLDKTVILVQIQLQQKRLHEELVKILNIGRLKTYAVEKSFAVSMDFRQMTDQMSLIQMPELKYFSKQLYDNFSKRVTKLYLNFGKLKEVSHLCSFPNIKVLYLYSNYIESLVGIQNMSFLEEICFDKNKIQSLEPLTNLTNLVKVSGSENKITSLTGLANLTKITFLTLYKNQIKEINNLQNLKLKELSLNNNPIQKIQNLNHMKDSLEQFYIGGTFITNIEYLYSFKVLKKLSLDALKLKKVDPLILKELETLTYLSLADNQIEKIDNLQAETSQLLELNLKNNRLIEISGFDSCNKLEILKLQKNFISNVTGITGIQHLKFLHLQENPLQDCTELYSFDNGLQFLYSKIEDNVDPLYAPKKSFYQKFEIYKKHRGMSSSGSNEDSELQDQ